MCVACRPMRISENEDEEGAQAEGNCAMGTSTICSSDAQPPLPPAEFFMFAHRRHVRSFLRIVKYVTPWYSQYFVRDNRVIPDQI
jgi:hypothetical protein